MRIERRQKRRITMYLEDRIATLKYQRDILSNNYEMLIFWSGVCGQIYELEILLSEEKKRERAYQEAKKAA